MSTDVQTPAEAYEYGEKIAVTLTGTVAVHDHLGLILDLSNKDSVQIVLGDGVEIKRLVPAEGEPQAGDVWRDRHGREWYCSGSGPSVRDASDRNHHWTFVNEQHGPLTLAYRPESTSDGA